MLLTNDLDRAEAARRKDQAFRAAIAVCEERRRTDYQASHRDSFIAHAQAAHDAEVARNRAAAIGGGSGTLDKPAQATQTEAADNSDADILANALSDPRCEKRMDLVRDKKAAPPSE